MMHTDAQVWPRRLDRHAQPGTRERVFADVAMAAVNLVQRRILPGDAPFDRAWEQALQLGDPEACWVAGRARLMFSRGPGSDLARKATIDEMLSLAPRTIRDHIL